MRAEHEAAFEEFVAARSPDLMRIAVLLAGGDRGHAEDLLQTALLKAYRRWGRIEGDPFPYLRRVLVTTTAGWRRLRATQEIVSLPAHDLAGPDATDAVAERDLMTAALATLPPRMRAVLVLRYTQDLSEAATAEALGCSLSTVKTQTARGLARLRALLNASATTTVLEEC